MWQTNIDIPEYPVSLGLHDRLFCLGSCFADNVGSRIVSLKLPVRVNPFGVLYNPHSISQAIGYLVGAVEFNSADCFEHQGLWRHFDFHSRISHADRDTFVRNVKNEIEASREFLSTSKLCVITLGTSFVWTLQTGQIVGNCHKLPGKQFNRRILSGDEVRKSVSRLISDIKKFNSTCHILFTVSPVRHLRDGLMENNRSKARLIDVCTDPVNQHAHVHYFPAWEIMMDELRDYRFYEADMVHPSEQAINYIFSKFSEAIYKNLPESYVRDLIKLNKLEGHKLKSKEKETEWQQKVHELRLQIENKYKISLNP